MELGLVVRSLEVLYLEVMGIFRRARSFVGRKDGVKMLIVWMAVAVAALPVLTPSLFTASSWETSLFSVSF